MIWVCLPADPFERHGWKGTGRGTVRRGPKGPIKGVEPFLDETFLMLVRVGRVVARRRLVKIELVDPSRLRIVVCALNASRASCVRSERPFPVRAIRVVRAVGQDGLAIRTGQLRSTRSRLTRSWCRSRDLREPSTEQLRGRRLTAPRVTDRPRLIGWSSLHLARHRSLTPLVVIAGTAWPVPEPTGSW